MSERNQLALDLCREFRERLIAGAQGTDPVFPWLELAEFALQWRHENAEGSRS